jgi:hypothetical protein
MLTPQSAFRFAAWLALAATAAAQPGANNWDAVKALSAGTTVRVVAGPETIRGRVDSVTDSALTVSSGKGNKAFDRQQVSAVSVQKPGHRKRNTLIGLAAGTGVGLGIGIAARAKPGQLDIVPNGVVVAAFTIAGAIVGTVVGVVIPSGNWREIYKK